MATKAPIAKTNKSENYYTFADIDELQRLEADGMSGVLDTLDNVTKCASALVVDTNEYPDTYYILKVVKVVKAGTPPVVVTDFKGKF